MFLVQELLQNRKPNLSLTSENIVQNLEINSKAFTLPAENIQILHYIVTSLLGLPAKYEQMEIHNLFNC